jgi:hypothetical protein
MHIKIRDVNIMENERGVCTFPNFFVGNFFLHSHPQRKNFPSSIISAGSLFTNQIDTPKKNILKICPFFFIEKYAPF